MREQADRTENVKGTDRKDENGEKGREETGKRKLGGGTKTINYNKKVPEGGLEPPRLIQPTDFKSVMSTNSITRAQI